VVLLNAADALAVGTASASAAYYGATQVWTSVPPFSPLDLTPSLWLDAADTLTITELLGSVSQWNDKSGNGYNVVQASGANQPITGTRTVNGLNVLDFNGTSHRLDRLVSPTQLVSTVDGTFTAFAVFQTDTIASGTGGVVTQDIGSGTRMPQMIRRTAASVETVRIEGGVFVDATAATLTTTAAVVASSVHRTNNIEAWIGGASNGATSTTGTNGTAGNGVRVGRCEWHRSTFERRYR
jgi:hypothetical protein